ncbi:hypothetical protein L1049_007716 [Liquidambar formosana]|uniref:Helicase C-terminal domain-containing protein n=1 Tax=Liquidambar formosana TaxID=63359 RepID=A0AAP0S2A9_LIQFO
MFVKKEKLSLEAVKQYKVNRPDELAKILVTKDKILESGEKVNLVVNYDLPVKYESPSEPDYEVYLHRIGRVGRFGRKGAVFNLLCSSRDIIMVMEKIENHFGTQVAEVNLQSDKAFEEALAAAGLA